MLNVKNKWKYIEIIILLHLQFSHLEGEVSKLYTDGILTIVFQFYFFAPLFGLKLAITFQNCKNNLDTSFHLLLQSLLLAWVGNQVNLCFIVLMTNFLKLFILYLISRPKYKFPHHSISRFKQPTFYMVLNIIIFWNVKIIFRI